jgi:DNA-binding MarR family transcriptional regulator
VDPCTSLARELVLLVRTMRDLNAVRPSGGEVMDLPTAAILGRVGDEGPLRLSTLADRLGLDLSTVSRQVPALERAGWLAREQDPHDRRAQLLRLTPQGRGVLADRRAQDADLLRAALPGWTDEDVAQLAASIVRLNADLTDYRASRAPSAGAAPTLQQEAS